MEIRFPHIIDLGAWCLVYILMTNHNLVDVTDVNK